MLFVWTTETNMYQVLDGILKTYTETIFFSIRMSTPSCSGKDEDAEIVLQPASSLSMLLNHARKNRWIEVYLSVFKPSNTQRTTPVKMKNVKCVGTAVTCRFREALLSKSTVEIHFVSISLTVQLRHENSMIDFVTKSIATVSSIFKPAKLNF